MNNKVIISASIVLYKENIVELTKTIESFLAIPLSKRLFLVDNTFTADFENKFNSEEIVYIANRRNLGFGKAHNQVIERIKQKSNYHLILNPDVVFLKDALPNLIEELKINTDVAMIAPRVLFPDGQHQFSCRKYPTISDLLIRRLGFLKPLFEQSIKKGEYNDRDLTKPFNPEYLTGCFQLYKTEDFIAINGFDERYFLYMEDIDICKKIEKYGKKKLYFPEEKVYHNLKQGSSKKIKLLLYHISSAFKYFNKWGIS
ncbi:Glyco_trans_2-like domain-containing protein [Tenacibaculum sp. 190524A02b]|uniref:glycosyltransferase n=1 Tax=Tenacibaculum vairaonense TaxID=3137860 RepID=UPI0032B111BD